VSELFDQALDNLLRVINGEQYNNLLQSFSESMGEEASCSFLKANYMMVHDFYPQYVNYGYLEQDLAKLELNNGLQTVDARNRVSALLSNLTPAVWENMQSEYAQGNVAKAKNYFYAQATANSQANSLPPSESAAQSPLANAVP
jgi:hypothetical protein